MSLSSNTPSFRHEYNGESFAFKYAREPLNLYLQADSNNKVFKAKFETNLTELKESLDGFCEYSLDKNLDDLLLSMAKDFDSKEMNQQYGLLHFKDALYSYVGEKNDLELIDAETLICRCAKLDQNAIENYFIKENGEKNEVLKKTNASMICGQCSSQVDSLFSELSIKHKIFGGKSYKDWNKLITNTLEQFAFYSPEEFQGAHFEIIKLSLPLVELKITVPHQNLTASFAKKSLMNYLSRELEVGLELEIFIDNSLSN